MQDLLRYRLSGLTTLLLWLALSMGSLQGQILISEWMASNGDSSVDEDGESSDWVEIWNRGNQSISLEGFSLSVNIEDLRQWVFPAITLSSGQRMLVWASGKDRVDPTLPLHTNFRLDADGGSLWLWYSDGQTLVSAYEDYPKQRRDVSYGLDDSGQNRFFLQPTPGQANASGVLGFVADTQFSIDRGFYTEPFSLIISSQTEGASIRYTTDGTMPTSQRGNVYTRPITIDQTTTLRAIAYRDGFEPSNVDTQTYLFLQDVIRQASDGRAPTGWPTRWGSNTVDYGMDPAVVDDPAYRDTIIDDMQTLPSYSIVMNLDDFFG
ncbi:MAG: chitobiase/beta-hexosaminidase C-terminal domain-containing protein, partial [Limisphaerales bacterium]